MKKFKLSKKIVIITIITLLVIAVIAFATYKIVNDENKLTVEEKEWITENIDVLQTVDVPNNLDIFGKNGSGVFFDFISDLETNYNLKVNEKTYTLGDKTIESRAFKVVDDVDKNHVVFYKEHYVLISKSKVNISTLSQLNGKKIGVLSTDEKTINKYLSDVSNAMLTTYETTTSLFQSLDTNTDIEFAIIPLEENLTSILTSNYYIDYHISDLNKYMVFDVQKDDTFSSIVKKYFATWKKENLQPCINENELELFIDALSISDKEIDNIQSKEYEYGFINNSPYEVLIGGTYGGIVSEYINRFSQFSDTEFKSIKYKNFAKFTEALANSQVNLYFNYYNLDTSYQKVDSLMNISFVVIAQESNPLVMNSVASLSENTIYVQKNSIIEKYLTSLGGINIKTYSNEKELKKISRQDNIIVLDKEIFNYYKKSFLSEYSIRYSNTLSETYNFYIKGNDTFNLLFEKYIQTLDPIEIKVKGNYNHTYTMQS